MSKLSSLLSSTVMGGDESSAPCPAPAIMELRGPRNCPCRYGCLLNTGGSSTLLSSWSAPPELKRLVDFCLMLVHGGGVGLLLVHEGAGVEGAAQSTQLR